MLKSARKEGKKQRDPEGRMPLAEHLRELRNRLMKAVLAILAVAVVAMFYYKDIADFLTDPVREEIGCDDGFARTKDGDVCGEITIQGLVAPFTIMMKVALTTGVVVASPVWLYQLWAFLAPGLHKQEKKYARGFVAAGVPLFLGGAFLAYILLPTAARALLNFSPDDTANLIQLDDFLDIVTRLVLVFGVAFELPLLLVMLNFGGIVKGRQMLGWWRFMVIGIAVFSAVATPTGDPLTMAALAVPIVLLYFTAVAVCMVNDRRRRRKDPYRGLDDDEASELDHTPEPLAPAGPAPKPSPTPEADGDLRDGYDDAT